MRTFRFSLLVIAWSLAPGFSAYALMAIPKTVEIPAGPFIAGSDGAEREAAYRLDEAAYGHSRTREWGWYDDERKRRKIEVGAYRITQTLITNIQYSAFAAKSPASATAAEASPPGS